MENIWELINATNNGPADSACERSTPEHTRNGGETQ